MSKYFNKKFVFIVFTLIIVLLVYINLNDDKSFILPKIENLFSSNNQIKESCLDCHQQYEGFSSYHNPKIIGCTSCHLGNKFQNEKEKAHQGMVLIPGNLKDAKNTCGVCHADQLSKINNSLMTTNSGIVAVDKFIFGELDEPYGDYHIENIEFTPAEKHLRDLCGNCHIGNEKIVYGKIDQENRGGGCNACHLNYSDKASEDLEKYHNSKKKILPTIHPSVTINITNNHCFGCHSRSSRISTNYEGWSETLLNENEIKDNEGYRLLQDTRVFEKQEPDVHFKKGLLCIDCHSSHEVMGDGKKYQRQGDAVSIQCKDCHFSKTPNSISADKLDVESQKIASIRKYTYTDKRIILKSKSNQPLVNTYLDSNNNGFMISKNDQKVHKLTKLPVQCEKDKAHGNLSCATCHTSWAPKCIGCHNKYDKDDEMGYDLLYNQNVKGQWVEYVTEFLASSPSLGVSFNKDVKEIKPAVPGMILTIDKGSFKNKPDKDVSFHRLFTANEPHTIVKEGRSCVSCHLNPYVLGYGSGKLEFNKNGKFYFTANYAPNKNDNLPEDAWIPFLTDIKKGKEYSTKTNFRPFNLIEQKNILTVGACLTCHKPNDKVMKRSLIEGVDLLISQKSKHCIIPKF